MDDRDPLPEIDTVEQAYEALDSFDPAWTKRALRFLVDLRDPGALERTLPLTQHSDPALRFVAKRAVRELREVAAPVQRRSPPTSLGAPEEGASEEASLPQAVGGSPVAWNADPRLEKLLKAPPRRREPPPRDGGVPMRWFDMEL